jgi:hypothetical protein
MGDFSAAIIGDGECNIIGSDGGGDPVYNINGLDDDGMSKSGRLFSDSVGDLRMSTRSMSKERGGGAGPTTNTNNVSISSIQNSPRVMRAAVFSNERPFDSRKSSENLLLRNNVSVGSRSLDPNTWSQIAIPVDLEPFLHPEKLVYPVIDSPK